MKKLTIENPEGSFLLLFSREEIYNRAKEEWSKEVNSPFTSPLFKAISLADVVVDLDESKIVKCRYDIVDLLSLGLEAYVTNNTQYCIVTEPFTRYWNKKLEVVEIHDSYLVVRPESGKPFVIDKQFVEMC